MRIKIKGHDVEGSASEIAELLALIENDAPVKPVVINKAAGGTPFVSEQVALDVLQRRPLGEAHVKVLKYLYSAGDDWTAAADLQRALGLSTREFAGVLGAFGRRLANTDGVGSRYFFDQYWDRENGYNLYRLPASVRSAVQKAKVAP